MKFTSVKAIVAQAMTIGLLAGAFAMFTPDKAQAQEFAFRVDAGYPHHDRYRVDRFGRRRTEEFSHHEEFVRHQERGRAHEYGGYRHGAPYRFR